MEKTPFNCPVCNNDQVHVVYPDTLGDRLPLFNYDFNKDLTNKSYRIVACKQCTHHYASPRPPNLYSYYTDDAIDKNYLQISSQRIITAKKIIPLIKKHKASGSLLDIGCATGDFLEIAKDHYEVEGLELSSWSSKMAKDRGHKIHTCTIEQLSANKQYDIITLWGVIEHFEFPRKEMEHIYNLLKPDGILFIWTPDISSITARILKKRWWNFQGQHIQLFTKKSLTRLLKNMNLELVKLGVYPYIMTLESLQNSLCRYPSLSRLTKPIFLHKYLRRFHFPLHLPGEMFVIYRKNQ